MLNSIARNSLPSTGVRKAPLEKVAGTETLQVDEFRKDAFALTKGVSNESLHRSLFSAVMQVSNGGLPGLAGVALAKVVTYALDHSQAAIEEKAQLANSALVALQYSADAPVAPLARDVFEKVRQGLGPQESDRIKEAGLRSIAQLEGWNIVLG